MNTIVKLLGIIFFSLALYQTAAAQDTSKSLAFKNNRPYRKFPYFYRPDLGYQIWQQFKLIQEANGGDALAQHELGLRYLLGEGIAVDTNRAVYWLKQAANQHLPSAMYNYGILLFNGWGVEWDPFSAFKYFLGAAKAGMVQAQYIVGILYTDNLLLKRDFNYAYYWIKKSAEGNYKEAEDVVKKIEPEIQQSVVDSITRVIEGQLSKEDRGKDNNLNLTSPAGLVYIDFNIQRDTIKTISDSMLIVDLRYSAADSVVEKLNIDSLKYLTDFPMQSIVLLVELAENGSPEAQSIIGRMYEKGIYFKENKIKAASYYFRAQRIDSPKGPFLLWKLTRSLGFLEKLQKAVDYGSPEAKFVWYGLSSANYDNRIAISDAMNILEDASNENYIPAMVELGLNYYTGRFIDRDMNEGLKIWERAVSLGSTEAKVRLISASIYSKDPSLDRANAYRQLLNASDNGSLLAEVTLAYCNENGIGIYPSTAEAVKYYRYAAQRGSQYAFRELQRLYDDIRPNDPEFTIN